MSTEHAALISESASATAIGGSSESQYAYQQLPAWRWRLAAFLLAGAAQLITISALIGSGGVPHTWAMLLLASAPAPLCAAAAFWPTAARYAVLAAAAVLIVGIIGAARHTGLFFVPALVAVVVGSLPLWRRPSAS
jgi:hypothetical protein